MKFERIIESISNVGGYFSGWLVPLMIVLVLYEVFMRYVVHQPPMVADEFSAYMLVAMLHMASSTWLNFPLQGPQMTLVIGFSILALLQVVEITKVITDIRAGIRIEEGAR